MNKSNIKRLEEMKNILLKYDLTKGITPKKVTSILEELGPTFIKIGQILSTRIDLIPKEYCIELSRLRGNIKQLSREELLSILTNEYDNIDTIFNSIDECIGSGSIAEVHKATLINNEEVIIKVCRPNVYEQMKEDTALLKKVISILHLNKLIKVIDLNDALDEILEVAYQESNFLIEKDHLIQFKRLNEDNTSIYSPRVYEDISTNRVLVMEYIKGIKVNEVQKLKNEGYDIEALSYILSNNYIKQALKDGFFHADPHPDNILINDNKINYIDLGMVGTLTKKDRELLYKCINNIIDTDYEGVANILLQLSNKRGEVDLTNLRNDISIILSEYSETDLESIDITKFSSKMFNMLRENNLVLHKEITMLIRGIIVVEASLFELNPNLNLISVLTNHVIENSSLIDSKKIITDTRKIFDSAKSLINIPPEILKFFKNVERGGIKLNLELSGSTKQVDKLENLLHELIIGIIDASLILAFSLQEDKVIRSIIIYFIIILSIWLFIKMIIDHIHRGY